MMRSLYSGVSGLRNHQTRMDVIANNISNVNTVGFKASRTIFQDVYSQTAQSASGATATSGGQNAVQIGLGVKLAAIDVLHTNAATQRTDNPLDLTIEGDGYLMIKKGDITYYTRAGNMYCDNAGNLVTTNGDFLLGFMGTSFPNPPDSTKLEPINVKGYTGIAIDTDGAVTGIDGTGQTVTIGYVALAMFTNPPGLEKVGGSLYAASSNSGDPVVTQPGEKGSGDLYSGGLEMANVDLAAEFTDMIVTQRGFQANSRVITTSDSMLEELVNLKR